MFCSLCFTIDVFIYILLLFRCWTFSEGPLVQQQLIGCLSLVIRNNKNETLLFIFVYSFFGETKNVPKFCFEKILFQGICWMRNVT